MPIIAPIPRTERRLMQKNIHRTRDKNYARRQTALLMLHRGDSVSNVARTLCCARSSVGRWIKTGLRYLAWRASGLYLPGADVAGRLNIFANYCARSSDIHPVTLVISGPAGVLNLWQ